LRFRYLPEKVDREQVFEVQREEARNKLPYGTCRLAFHDTQLVQKLYGAIQEYGGFAREEWVL
jgi:hypothetical protein